MEPPRGLVERATLARRSGRAILLVSTAAVAVVALLALSAVPAQQWDPSYQKNQKASEAEVERMLEVLDLEPGDVVADVGAGNGRFTVELAEAVGPTGTIYATEVTDEQIGWIERNVERAGVDNVVVVKNSATDVGLPADCCDVIMLRVVYHHLAEPAAMNASFLEALRPDGRLVIIEDDPDPGGRDAPGVPENRGGMGIAAEIVVEETRAAGFELVERYDSWPNLSYCLVLRPAGAPR